MSLKDVIRSDIDSVFLDEDDFAQEIIFYGKAISAVIDTSDSHEVKNQGDPQSLGSFSWGYRIFAKAIDFDRRPKVNDYVTIDNDEESPKLISRVEEEMGMFVIYVLENAS